MRIRRWLKISLSLVSGLIVGLGILLVVFLFVLDDRDRRSLLVRAVNGYTEHRLSIDGDFTFRLSLAPSISAHQMSFDSGTGNLRLRAREVQLQLRLKPLLQGIFWVQHLALRDVVVIVEGESEKPGGAPEATGKGIGGTEPPALLPVVESIDIQGLVLSYHRPKKTPVQFSLEALSLNESEGEPRRLAIQGQGAFAGLGYRIEGSMGNLASLLAPHRPFPVRIDLTGDEAVFSAAGTLEHTADGPSLRFDIQGALEAPADIFALFGETVPALGRFEGSATLSGTWDRLRAENLTLNLTREPDITANAQGSIGNLWTGEGAAVALSAHIRDTDLVAWLVPEALLLPALDDLTLAGQFHLDEGVLSVGDFLARVKQSEGFQAEFAGSAQISGLELPGDFSAMDLDIRFSSPTTEAAKPFMFEFLPELGPTSGQARLIKGSGAFAFEDIEIRIGAEKSMTIGIRGRIDNVTFLPGDFEEEHREFHIDIEATRTERVAHLFGIRLPEVGPVSISGTYSGSDLHSRLDGLTLRAGRSNRLLLEAGGSLGFGDFTTDQWLDKVDLRIQGSSRDTAAVGKLIGRELPELGPVRTRFQLGGGGKELRMSRISATVGHAKSLRISASGNVGRVLLKPELAFKTIELQVSAEAPSTSALAPLAGRELPDLGELRLAARLSDRGGSPGLHSGRLRVGPAERPVITGNGGIGSLSTIKDTSWKLNFQLESDDLAKISGYPLPDLGVLRGHLVVSDADGSLGIEDIEIVSEDADLLTLRLSGVFDDITRGDQLKLQGDLTARDLTLFGALFGQDWPTGGRIKASGRLHGRDKKLAFEGAFQIGSTRFTGELSGSLTGRRPKFTGKIHTPRLFLADIGIAPPSIPRPGSRDKKRPSDHFFSREPLPLAWTQAFDLELDVGADEITGVNLSIDSLVALVSLEDGELTINPLALEFEGGVVLVDLAVDTGPEPWAALQVSADDVEMGNALAQVQDRVPVEGSLNVFVDLRGEGRSPHEIASSLGGDFDIAAENVTLPRRQLNLFAVDFLGWAISSTVARDQDGEIDCGIARFSIKDGVAESQALIADGPALTVTGKGSLNLKEETVDFVLYPKKKRRFWASADPVKINGPLSAPSVKPLPTGTAAIAGAAVVAPLIVIPTVAAGYLWNLLGEGSGENSPCLDLKARGLKPPAADDPRPKGPAISPFH